MLCLFLCWNSFMNIGISKYHALLKEHAIIYRCKGHISASSDLLTIFSQFYSFALSKYLKYLNGLPHIHIIHNKSNRFGNKTSRICSVDHQDQFSFCNGQYIKSSDQNFLKVGRRQMLRLQSR